MSIKLILFNTDMVRAILDGRKTATRRVIKKPVIKQDGDNDLFYLYENSDDCFSIASWKNTLPDIIQYSPYQPGDILYVREAWAKDSFGNYVYKSDYVGTTLSPQWKWHPSIHMPKEAARIWLKVTDVRVERLQDMIPYDAYKEGYRKSMYGNAEKLYGDMQAFYRMWESTVKKKDIPLYGWDANPWAWVIEFERTVKP